MTEEPAFEHAETPFQTLYGAATLHVFCFGPHEEDNVLCVAAPGTSTSPQPPLVRVQSACYTAEIFRSTDCDCHEQLHTSLELIHAEGGYLIYMLSDGRGAGLLTKVRGLALGESEGLDTYDAYERLGVETDPRDYERVAAVLREVRVGHLRLLTNNPRKVDGLTAGGLDVERVPLEIPPTPYSRPYLETKRDKFGHLLNL